MTVSKVNSGTAQFIGTIITAAVALIGVIFTALYQFGRAQRLRLAIQVRESIPAEDRGEWEAMIKRDVQAIAASSQGRSKAVRNWAIAFYLAGASSYAIGSYAPLPHWARATLTTGYFPLIGVSLILQARYIIAPTFTRLQIAKNLKDSEELIASANAAYAESQGAISRLAQAVHAWQANVLRAHADATAKNPEAAGLLDDLIDPIQEAIATLEALATEPETQSEERTRNTRHQ